MAAVRVWNRTIDPSAGLAGTLTCVARVTDDPDHWVAISAAHVLAPLSFADGTRPQQDDEIVFEISGRAPLSGRLWSWLELQRVAEGFSNRFDAALVTIGTGDAKILIAALKQPNSVAEPRAADKLSFAGASSAGSGMFDGLPFTGPMLYRMLGGGLASVAFEGTLNVRVASASGDSGSLMTSGNRGVGMLIANQGSVSQFLPLRPLLEEFALAWPGEQTPTAVPSIRHAAEHAEIAEVGDASVDTLARTLWGEARGEPLNGIRAVAAVVMNRASHPSIRWWGSDVIGVCRARLQFSCWNADDPNLPRLLQVDDSDDKFRICRTVAREAVQHRLQDERRLGATHYHNKKVAPTWARGKVPCADIRNHLFYNNIEG